MADTNSAAASAAVSSIPLATVHGGDIRDESLPSDPLSQSGTYIDVETEPPKEGEGKVTDVASMTEENRPKIMMEVAEAENATPVQRAGKSMDVANVERPSWLPEGWGFETRVRANGATAGLVDKYYYEPVSGAKFRSKAEVLYFLQTGDRRKKGNTGAGDDATPSETPSSKMQKKSASKKEKKKSTVFFFDSANPPESVCWTQTDTCADTWEPSINGVKVPAARRQEWDAVFSTLAKLGEKNLS